jgi:hypothetical protein
MDEEQVEQVLGYANANRGVVTERDQLRAEVERLLKVKIQLTAQHIDDMVEVERLRAALEEIANEDHGEHPWSWQDCFDDIQETARNALAKENVP